MAEAPPPLRLLDRVREKLRVKHYSLRTGEAYLYWIRRYIRFWSGALSTDSERSGLVSVANERERS